MATKTMKSTDSLLEFPCQFPIKALGRKSTEFGATVVEIVKKHAPDIMENTIKSRTSRGEKYISITMTITATTQAQLDAIYQDLTDCREVLMAL